jgi:putative nucleotidyltransferase with HDIG domain
MKIIGLLRKRDNFDLRTDIYVKILIGVVTVIVTILFLPNYENTTIESEVGTIWSHEDLIAAFSFPIYKDEQEYENEKKEAMKVISPVFFELRVKDEDITDTVNEYFNLLDEVLSKAATFEKNREGGINSDKLYSIKENLGLEIADEHWQKLFQYSKGEIKDVSISYPNLKSVLRKMIISYSAKSIININKSTIPVKIISVKRNKEKMMDSEPLDKVLDKNEMSGQIREKINSQIQNETLKGIFYSIADKFVKENLIYDKSLTDLEIQNKIEQIPKTIGIVKENERIISKHDPITKISKQKLDSYKKVRLEKIGMQDYFIQYLGKVLIVLVLLTLLVIFLFYIRSRVFFDNSKIALIASLIIIINFFAFMSLKLDINAPVELLIFVSVASIMLTILFDSRLAFYVTVIISLLVAAVRGGDFTILFFSLSGSVLAIFSVRDIKNRSQIFRSFFFILIGYTVSILAIGLDRNEGFQKILVELIYGAVNSVMSPIMAYGLLIFYERLFKITTDLTLLELADFNHPLLKELSTKAPGTFHHSIVMGSMSEAAAEAIGANRVLTRVGCYYHDIGKIVRPEYYVENQIERINRHEVLNPNMSAKIIISHVKDGIELAKKYKLPKEIIDFIPMHHGTTTVSYFYNKAMTTTDEKKEDVKEHTYMYSGPKPQSKETAIVMLADTIEASARAIEDSTPKKLEDQIDEIITRRFMEGQLDECNLTLKDLTLIKKSFLNILVGIHHQRIKYPEYSKD